MRTFLCRSSGARRHHGDRERGCKHGHRFDHEERLRAEVGHGVAKGDTVQFTNGDTAAHQVAFKSTTGVTCTPASIVLQPSQSGSCTFATPGSYSYSVSNFKGKTYRGSITVTGTAAPDTLGGCVAADRRLRRSRRARGHALQPADRAERGRTRAALRLLGTGKDDHGHDGDRRHLQREHRARHHHDLRCTRQADDQPERRRQGSTAGQAGQGRRPQVQRPRDGR